MRDTFASDQRPMSPDESRVFVPGKPFQPSQMFSGKVGAYPSEAGKACQGQTP